MDFAPVEDALLERRGLCVVTGTAAEREALCRRLVHESHRAACIAFLSAPLFCEEDLIERLLTEFGVVSDDEVHSRERAGLSVEELAEALKRFLVGLASIGATAILVIDNAQELPDPVFECVGLLTDLEQRGTPLLQIVLAGAPDLRRRLRRERYAALADRVVLHHSLSPRSKLAAPLVSVSTAATVAFVTAVLAAMVAAMVYQRFAL